MYSSTDSNCTPPKIQAEGSQTWDLEGLLIRLKGRNDRLLMLVRVFQQVHPERMERLKSAHDERDIAKIGFSAHEIKGAAASLKAMALYQLSCDLEDYARSDEPWANVDALVGKVLAESQNLHQQIAMHCS